MSDLFGSAVSFWRDNIFHSPEEEAAYYSTGKGEWYAHSLLPIEKEEGRDRVRGLLELCALKDKLNNEDAITAFLRLVLQDIERERNSAVIAYMSAGGFPRRSISFDESDADRLQEIIKTIPSDLKTLDFIIHSRGGSFSAAHSIVKTLRDRFERINFLIPREAKAAAFMTALSADEIIAGDSLFFVSPFDPMIQSPNGEYLDTHLALSMLRFAKWSLLLLPWTRSQWEGWTFKTAKEGIKEVKSAKKHCETLVSLWLTKYMFGHSFVEINDENAQTLKQSAKQAARNANSAKDYRKAERIASFFTDTELHILHERPIASSRISNFGLNISKADKRLGDYMNEAYTLADRLFCVTNTAKVWISPRDYRLVLGEEIVSERQSNIASVKTETAGGVYG